MGILVENGRPLSMENRSDAECEVYACLDALGIAYQRADHDPAETMEDCRAISEALDCHVCKNLFLTNRQGTAFYLLLMPADKPFKTKELSAQIGSARLSFASPERMQELLGTYPGAATVLGLMKDKEKEVTLLIDRDLLKIARIGAHPRANTSTLAFSQKDIFGSFLKATGHTYRAVTLLGAD